MQLIGQAIRHETFGKGVVTDLEHNVLTICFSEGEKKFIYPDAFKGFLTLKNDHMQHEVESVLEERDHAREQRFEELQEKQEKKYRLENMKVSPRSQAAFSVEPGDRSKVLDSWTVSTGCYLSGYSKGEPRIPDRLKPNSLCLLTERFEGTQEADRCIIGAFMVPEDFFGTACQDGIITAHPEFRMELSEPLPFWSYVSDTPEHQRWGKTAYKYFSNTVAERMLYDMAVQCCKASKESNAEAFYQYYCRLNHLPARELDL